MQVFWPKEQSIDQAIEQLEHSSLLRPFSEEILSFTNALSKQFVKMRTAPEIVALGYWLRKANIKQMQKTFEHKHDGKIIRPRGTVFHIAPSNVDTIFVYSWMLSLLAGNRNIVRVSSKEHSSLNRLLQVILDELAKEEFIEISSNTIICTYGHHEKGTELFSMHCHTRVIWGGDETVRTISHVPLAPLANELTFPDRFSLAVIKSDEICSLTTSDLKDLTERFYNDVFWFDQMACSSPRLVVWVGLQTEQAQEIFWSTFKQTVHKKQYELLAATQVLKYTTTLQLATEQEVDAVHIEPYFSRVNLTMVKGSIRNRHCGGGMFYELNIPALTDLATYISDKDQTLSYFGFGKEEFEQLSHKLASRGIDRIVPIGHALDFDSVWDGQDFLTSFTREIYLM